MQKLIFIDTETGGTDKNKHPILQLSGFVEVDGVEEAMFDITMAPFKGQLLNKKALEVNNLTIEEINTFQEPQIAFSKFKEILDKFINKYDKEDKFIFVGYNSRFDEDFLREFFINNAQTDREKEFGGGYGNYFFTPSVDVMQMAIVRLINERAKLPNFKLATVCEYFGVTGYEWHDALDDIKATRELFYKLIY